MSAKKKSKKIAASPSPTARQNSDHDLDLDSQFKVVLTPQKVAQQGNLTGPERRVKDSCADWHNYAEKWKTLNSRGGGIVTEISNSKIESFEKEESDKTALFDKLQILSDEMTKLYESMEKVVSKMKRLTQCFQGLNELSLNQSSTSDILFQTWTLDRFVENSTELQKMYEKELELKKCIVENVCHSESREMAMFQISAWLHEPYISKSRHEFLITSMLVEVGLK